MINRRLWVPDELPEYANIWSNEYWPITHLSDHPHVGTEQILSAGKRRIKAIGYDMEGVLAPFGAESIPDEVLEWLEYERQSANLGRFVITNCRDYEKVEHWMRQLNQVNMSIFSPHAPNIKRGGSEDSSVVVDKNLRKPKPELYQRAIANLEIEPEQAAFVGDKFSDAKGAAMAGFIMRILTPRYGQADHIGDKLSTRTFQWLKMQWGDIYFFNNDSEFLDEHQV